MEIKQLLISVLEEHLHLILAMGCAQNMLSGYIDIHEEILLS